MMKRACLGMVLACLGLGCGDDGRDGLRKGAGGETARVDAGHAGRDAGTLDAGVRIDGGAGVGEDPSEDPGDAGAIPPPPPRRDAGSVITPADADLSEQVLTKLIECTLLATGAALPASADIRDEADRCTARCNLAADCDAIRAYACDATSPPGLSACLMGCPAAPADGFVCGDGARVAHALRCDGRAHCADGADETGCMRACAGDRGAQRLGIACDGTDDCADGADGASCLLCGT